MDAANGRPDRQAGSADELGQCGREGGGVGAGRHGRRRSIGFGGWRDQRPRSVQPLRKPLDCAVEEADDVRGGSPGGHPVGPDQCRRASRGRERPARDRHGESCQLCRVGGCQGIRPDPRNRHPVAVGPRQRVEFRGDAVRLGGRERLRHRGDVGEQEFRGGDGRFQTGADGGGGSVGMRGERVCGQVRGDVDDGGGAAAQSGDP